MYYGTTAYLHTGWNSQQRSSLHFTETALSHPSLYVPVNSRRRNLTSMSWPRVYTAADLWDPLCGDSVSIALLMTMLICGFQGRQTVFYRFSELAVSHRSNNLLSRTVSTVRLAQTLGFMKEPNDYRLVGVP
jgi:hypothetical protein